MLDEPPRWSRHRASTPTFRFTGPRPPLPAEIETLKIDLAKGRVMVGSGVSVMACGQQLVGGHPAASWRGLLDQGVDRLRVNGAADGAAELLRD